MGEMAAGPARNSPWNLSSDRGYGVWRAQKLTRATALHQAAMIDIRNLSAPSAAECAALIARCADTNMALYQTPTQPGRESRDPDAIRADLRGFSDRLGLHIAETHRSAGKSGIVALTVSDAPGQRGYIPYSAKPMNWHTDGYYNGPDQQIRAMVLHCVRPAQSGGRNRFLDPEIAYIRLRDHNPAFIAALMHPRAMTIPENREENGNLRPVSIGPVFSLDPSGCHLVMRYTARSRSISWRDDAITKSAVAFLQNLLENGDPLMQSVTLGAGQGILCNNALHNRTGFDPSSEGDNARLMFRVRFHNRVKGS